MRKQRAFAKLTDQEIHQIAEWLRHDTYDAVRERIAKPRPEGFGLAISNKPLQVLFAKANRLDKINARITSGQKLTLTEFDAINAAEAPATEEVHDAIMQATYDLATSGDNTPTQLLALQRLADFPARAEIREQRLELDLQKHTHKLEMDTFRKQIATERLDLAKRSFTLREEQTKHREQRELEKAEKAKSKDTASQNQADELGPVAHDWEGVRARARQAFNITPEESARRAHLRATWKGPDMTGTSATSPDSQPNQQPSASPITNNHFSSSNIPKSQSNSADNAPQSLIAHCTPPFENDPCSSVSIRGPIPQSAIENQKSQISPMHSHTIRRCRAYTHGLPAKLRDDSWINECPCGATLPCRAHPGLAREVRYVNPCNNDYRNALERHTLPFHLPTPEEINPTITINHFSIPNNQSSHL